MIKKDEMMKILIYTHEFIPWRGGVATYNYELAMGLSDLGHEVIVLAPKYYPEDATLDKKMTFTVVRTTLPIHSVMQLNRNIKKLPGSAYRFLRALQQYDPDRVLVTQVVAHESAALARLFRVFRFTLIVHGTEIYMHFAGESLRSWPKRLLMRWFFHKATSIICVSRSTKDLLEQNISGLGKIISVVHLGIDPDKPSITDVSKRLLEKFDLQNQKVILTVARLSKGKGQDTVIKALPRILREIPNTKYVVVGDGPERSELGKLVDELRLKKSVVFTGGISREELGSFYNICDVFVMLSRRGKKESFGLVYLEAWVYEKPVIGGNTGGVSEVIEDRRTGILVDPLDVDTAAKALCLLLKNKNMARAMGRAGHKRVEEAFSRKAMAQKTLELL